MPEFLDSDLPFDLQNEEGDTTALDTALTVRSEIVLLYEQHSLSLLRFGQAVCGNESIAVDLLQESFLRYFEYRRKNSPPEDPLAWLCHEIRVLARSVDSRVRREQNAAQSMAETQEPEPATPESLYTKEELLSQIESILSPRERQILLLRLDGFSYREIADMLEITTGTVGAKLTRAIQKVQQRLSSVELPSWLAL